MERPLSFFIVLLALAHKGASLIADTVPEAGTIKAGFEGEGGIVFECSVYTDSDRIDRQITQWSLEDTNAMTVVVRTIQSLATFNVTFNLTGDERNDTVFPSFDNVLTLLNFTADLDGQTLFCGTGGALGEPLIADFPLRIYRPPVLTTDGAYTITEGTAMTFSVEGSPPAFPTPSGDGVMWFKDGQPVSSVTGPPTITFTYAEVAFSAVRREDRGSYRLTAINSDLEGVRVIGTDNGTFSLDVLFGPESASVPGRHVVLEGNNLNVPCATNLQSNPAATVEWRDNNGAVVADTARYDLNNAAGSVSLDITPTQGGDNGQWSCTLNVMGPPGTIGGENVGNLTVTIDIVVVVPPNPPGFLTVISGSSGATNLFVCWQPPQVATITPVTRYEVSLTGGGPGQTLTRRTASNETNLNVTGLDPGSSYSISVVAIAVVDDVEGTSIASDSFEANTTTTVPAPLCSSVTADAGIVTVVWSFTHTGGLELTNLTVHWFYIDGTFTNTSTREVAELSQNSLLVSGLEVGFVYTFSVEAANELGNETVVCPPFTHSIGIPRAPKTPKVVQEGATDVRINITTVAPGVGAPLHSFRFDVKISNGDDIDLQTFEVDNYVSGQYKDFLIEDLTVGELYTFSARSANDFGVSTFAPADIPITISGVPPVTTPPSQQPPTVVSQSNAGAIAGGVVGGLIAVILIVVIILAVIFILFKTKGARAYQVEKGATINNGSAERNSGVKVQEIDLGQELTQHAGNSSPADGEGELHYADLATFSRPESVQKNRPSEKPTETEEPVEYATIASLTAKKASKPTAEGGGMEEDEVDKSQTSTTLV